MSHLSSGSDFSSPSVRLQAHFSSLTNPRRRKVIYPLVNVVTIAVCAVICGSDDFVAIATWGRMTREWLATILDLSAGVPSHDRFNAIVQALAPGTFEKCLLGWIAGLYEAATGQGVAIDGETLRGRFDKASGKSAFHLVSPWATGIRFSLGQMLVDEKSNEITAILTLFKLLELKSCLVPIDAMGCQTAIAEAILACKADFVLAVKDDQPTLHRSIVDYFTSQMEDDFARIDVVRCETKEKGHGRLEHRAYYFCDALLTSATSIVGRDRRRSARRSTSRLATASRPARPATTS